MLRGRLLGLARGWGNGLGPLALLACLPEEQHEFGLIAFGLALRSRGWRVAYLGSDTPLETTEAAASTLAPALVVLNAVDAARITGVAPRLRALQRAHRVALGGAGAADGGAPDGPLVLAGDPVVAADRRHRGSSAVTAPMRLGYACVNTRLPSAARTLRLANVTPARLRELIAANLDALESILRWNAENGIEVFRLTSNLIPFGSHPANTVAWWDEFAERLDELGSLIAQSGGRRIHAPGPVHGAVVGAAGGRRRRTRGARVPRPAPYALGLDGSHKIVLHVGSGSADPAAATRRFAAAFKRLSDGAR